MVTEISGELISQLANGVRVHVENPALAVPMCLALTKLCEHPNNSVAVADTSIIQTLSFMQAMVTSHEEAAEAVASLVRPLSIIAEVRRVRTRCVRTLRLPAAFARCVCPLRLHTAFARCVCTLRLHIAFARCVCTLVECFVVLRC